MQNVLLKIFFFNYDSIVKNICNIFQIKFSNLHHLSLICDCSFMAFIHTLHTVTKPRIPPPFHRNKNRRESPRLRLTLF